MKNKLTDLNNNGIRKDCPFWPTEPGKKGCSLLKETICKTKECGFYPPVVDARKKKIKAEKSYLLRRG